VPSHTTDGTGWARRCCIRRCAGWLACVTIMLGIGAFPAAAQEFTGFRRGIGIAHAMGWADVEQRPSRPYVFPPFAGASRALTADELVDLRRMGFDFIRLAVDPGPFLQVRGQRRDELDAILLERVNLILAAGLAVVVDMHPGDTYEGYDSRALTGGVDTPAFAAFVELLVRTAGLLYDLRSQQVALEIMNEPVVSAEAWQPMLEAAYQAVRLRAPTLHLVLGGGQEGMPEGMMRTATRFAAHDTATMFTFHYYEPYQFTHQGASWNTAHYLADVPYPALSRPLAESMRATGERIDKANLSPPQKAAALLEARRQLESYRLFAFNRASMAHGFDRIAAWARRNRIDPRRILLGEFGARRDEPQSPGGRDSERAAWFRDVREEAEARGFGWAAWVYRGSGGFSLTQGEASTVLEPDIVRALGLSAMPRARRSP
jgi:endoglucanase